jgi:hypothetical protein
MAETIPEDIKDDLKKAAALHARTSSDYQTCIEFSKLVSDLLGRLEDEGCDRMADKIMGILLDCNPKEGAHCDNSMRVGDRMRKIVELLDC